MRLPLKSFQRCISGSTSGNTTHTSSAGDHVLKCCVLRVCEKVRKLYNILLRLTFAGDPVNAGGKMGHVQLYGEKKEYRSSFVSKDDCSAAWLNDWLTNWLILIWESTGWIKTYRSSFVITENDCSTAWLLDWLTDWLFLIWQSNRCVKMVEDNTGTLI